MNLITNKGITVGLLSSPEVKKHFNDSSSYANVVLDQINNDRIYDQYFKSIENGIIVDCGANIGLFSLYAFDVNNTVYAIEPTPTHFEKLEHLTKSFSNIKKFQQALGPENGPVTFYMCPNNSTMNSIANEYGNKITVDGIRLDTFLEKNGIDHVDFLKMDIEGSEMLALTKEIITNVKSKVKQWFIEVHVVFGKDIIENRQILKKLFADCGINMIEYRHDCLVSNNDQQS